MLDKAQPLQLTPAEMTVLVGGMRARYQCNRRRYLVRWHKA